MSCEPAFVTKEFKIALTGCAHDGRIQLCKEWLLRIRRDCPDGEDLWFALFEIVTAQIESGKPLIVIEELNMNASKHDPTHQRIVTIFGILAGLCIVGGVIGVIWNAVATTEFNLWGAKLTTGHVGVAFVGIGMVSAVVAVRSLLKHQTDVARIKRDQ